MAFGFTIGFIAWCALATWGFKVFKASQPLNYPQLVLSFIMVVGIPTAIFGYMASV